MQRVCLVSSGTGGHLMPAVVLAQALQESGHQPLLCTAGRPVEEALLSRLGVEPSSAVSLGPAGSGSGPFGMARAVRAARKFLRSRDVDLVVSTGGRTSFAVGVAAKTLGLPLCILEQNAVPGRANRWLSRVARRTYLGLPIERSLPRAMLTGTPLRREIGHVDRARARKELGLDREGHVILVTGGSQGARALNEMVPEALCAVDLPLQILHLSGSGAEVEVRRRYANARTLSVHVRPMAIDMAALYAAADLVVCRGGGGTVAELAAAARGALIIPYPHHKDRQQYHNGMVLAAVGAAILIEQQDLEPRSLSGLISKLISTGRYVAMGEHAGRLARPEAASHILEDLHRVSRLERNTCSTLSSGTGTSLGRRT